MKKLSKLAALLSCAVMMLGASPLTVSAEAVYERSAVSPSSAAAKSDNEKEQSTLPAPTGFKTEVKEESVTLSWKAVSGAMGYRVYIYDEDSDEYVKCKDTKKTSCTITDLSKGTEYKFKVAAVAERNGKTVVQEKSGVIKVKTKGKASGKTTGKSSKTTTTTTQKSPNPNQSPKEFGTPNFSDSKNNILKNCGIGNYREDKQDDGSVYYTGETYWNGTESRCLLHFTKKGELYSYTVVIPASYSRYLDFVSAAKDTFGYDYIYDDGKYYWLQLYSLSSTTLDVVVDYDDDAIQYSVFNDSLLGR